MWKEKQLGEVLELHRGYDLPQRLRRPGTVPIISSSGYLDTHSEARVLGPGVVTGRYGTIGEVFFIEEDFWPLNTTLFVSDFKGNDPRYAAYLLQTIDFQTHSGKSGVPGINRNDIHKLRVALPLLPEQRAIAAALSDVDALLAALDRLLAKKRAVKTAAMQQLLTGRQRLPGFSGEWRKISLGESGLWSGGGTPSKRTSSFWGGPIPWATPKDFLGPEISSTQDRITLDAVKASATCVIPPSSVLIVTRSGVLRHTVPIATNPIPVAINQDVKALTPYDRIHSAFLVHAVRSLETTILNRAVKEGTTVESVDFKLLKSLLVPLPERNEQEAIAAVLSDMDTEIDALEARRAKTAQLKQGMMQELLTGRTRLVTPETAHEIHPEAVV